MHFGFLSARPEAGGGVQRGTRSVEVDGPCNATATASGWPTDRLSCLNVAQNAQQTGRKLGEKARNFGLGYLAFEPCRVGVFTRVYAKSLISQVLQCLPVAQQHCNKQIFHLVTCTYSLKLP